MGFSTTPTYRIEFTTIGRYAMTSSAWRKEYGRPTDANLARHIDETEASFLPGGVNEHIGNAGGITIVRARIVRQRDDAVFATLDRVNMRKAG